VSTAGRLAAFAALLALLFGGGALAGAAIGPAPAGDEEAAVHGGAEDAAHSAPDPVRGLGVAANGLRLAVADTELRRGRPQPLEFRIVDERGRTVRDFEEEHTKRMHLILARRDLTGFQHLHPDQRADGTWTTEVTLREPGSYRLLADFARGGEAHTLASDLRVDGRADLRPLPAAAATAVSDGGYDVALDPGAAGPGEEADLRFTITRGGTPVRTEPYLGAGGHLVALREGDLAFLHVHPTAQGTATDPAVVFGATFPTEGRYRLFLQFQHEGRVHTVAFTHEVCR